jgi:hypothetical protein
LIRQLENLATSVSELSFAAGRYWFGFAVRGSPASVEFQEKFRHRHSAAVPMPT